MKLAHVSLWCSIGRCTSQYFLLLNTVSNQRSLKLAPLVQAVLHNLISHGQSSLRKEKNLFVGLSRSVMPLSFRCMYFNELL